jgi:NAD(P)H dehydrogenase (quinone)
VQPRYPTRIWAASPQCCWQKVKHAGKSYRPTGPQLLNGRDMAAIVARAVGHRVRPVNLPIWMLGKVARQQGIDPYQISCLRFYMQDMQRGTFEFEGGVTNVVEELTGTPAESFEATARRYATLPFARQTLANRIRAFLKFNLTPFYPGYNFDKFDRQLRLPTPTKTTLSIEDAQWRASHALQMSPASGTPRQPRPVAIAANPI